MSNKIKLLLVGVLLVVASSFIVVGTAQAKNWSTILKKQNSSSTQKNILKKEVPSLSLSIKYQNNIFGLNKLLTKQKASTKIKINKSQITDNAKLVTTNNNYKPTPDGEPCNNHLDCELSHYCIPRQNSDNEYRGTCSLCIPSGFEGSWETMENPPSPRPPHDRGCVVEAPNCRLRNLTEYDQNGNFLRNKLISRCEGSCWNTYDERGFTCEVWPSPWPDGVQN